MRDKSDTGDRTDKSNDNNLSRNQTIDIVKGLCIIFVLINHTDWNHQERLKYLFPFWIEMAVPVFMIISGYVHAISFKNRKINSFSKSFNLSLFVNRFIRYTIPFIIIYCIEYIFLLMTNKINLGWNFFIHLITGGIGPGSYYYPLIIQFLLIYSCIYFFIKKWEAGGLVTIGIFNLLYELFQYSYNLNDSCYRLLIFRYIFLIGYGCYLATSKRKIKRIWNLFSMGLGGAFILLTQYFNIVPPFFNYNWSGTSCLAVLFILPIVPYFLQLDLKCPFIEVTGKFSYSIFLIQMAYFAIFSGYVSLSNMTIWLQLIINISIIMTIGIIFHLWQEKIVFYFVFKIADLDFAKFLGVFMKYCNDILTSDDLNI